MPVPPKVLVLHATGTNRDLDVSRAFELAGAQPEIVHLNQLRWGDKSWRDFQLLVLPGGFSYADALGAGKLLALDLQIYFEAEITRFIQSGKPVIGICNGFQALVKSGILPGHPSLTHHRGAQPTIKSTLTFNEKGHFECRWVYLQAKSQSCLWTKDLHSALYCPVAHGEGRFTLDGPHALGDLHVQDQVALIYAHPDGSPAYGAYPANPNGSVDDIAGLCNPAGNVLGLMPHPENHIFSYQHPRWTRGDTSGNSLQLFTNGVNYARQM